MFKLLNKKTKKKINLYNFNIMSFYKKPIVNFYILKLLDISYTGKTYKWSLKNKTFKLIFNKANKTFIFFKNKLKFKKLLKNKYRFFLENNYNYNKIKIFLYKIRRYNVFTQRGLKIKNFFFYKKKGKISTYK